MIRWYAAHMRARELDELLAAGTQLSVPGTDLATRRLCEARARLLVRRSFRFALAQEIDDIIRLAASPQAADPSPPTVWTADIQLEEVRDSAEALRLVVGALRTHGPPEVQGIALALLLLRDGHSPLNDRWAHGDLRLAAEAAARALATPPASTAHALAPTDKTATMLAVSREAWSALASSCPDHHAPRSSSPDPPASRPPPLSHSS